MLLDIINTHLYITDIDFLLISLSLLKNTILFVCTRAVWRISPSRATFPFRNV